jgi:hypothetical protein
MVVGALALSIVAAGPAYARQADAIQQAAAAAAKASPELVTLLSKEVGGSAEQAAGAAGALFGLAKARLQPDQFAQVAKAVPGMDMLLKAAPALGGATGGAAAGGLSGLTSMTSAFSKLGLKPEMVAKAIPLLTSYVSKLGGANVGALLAGVLK